ncbi:MAG: DoxX family protein [Anaerolineae bacterium]
MLWAAQIVAAVLMGQTLFFKFTADPGAVQLFTTLGVEPWGRYGTGVLELIAVVLLLVPAPYLGKHARGAVLAPRSWSAPCSLMTKLGFEGTYGQLTVMAVVVLVCCLRWSGAPICRSSARAARGGGGRPSRHPPRA